jgi:hypothetical protein
LDNQDLGMVLTYRLSVLAVSGPSYFCSHRSL